MSRGAGNARAGFMILVLAAVVGCGKEQPLQPSLPPTRPYHDPSSSPPFDPKDFIEALFLGTGPLANRDSPGCSPGLMSGWPPGTTIRVWMSSGLFEAQREGVQKPLEQLPEATHGLLRALVGLTGDPNPIPRTGEITVASAVPNAAELGCPSGCAIPVEWGGPGVLQAVRVVWTASPNDLGRGLAHEIGHAAFGFCHVSWGASTRSVMGSAPVANLTGDDMAAVRAVYGAGLHGGSTRADFLAAGLIYP